MAGRPKRVFALFPEVTNLALLGVRGTPAPRRCHARARAASQEASSAPSLELSAAPPRSLSGPGARPRVPSARPSAFSSAFGSLHRQRISAERRSRRTSTSSRAPGGMSDDGSPGSALRALTTKLRHSLLDIRERALASLAFKLDNGLLGASDVGRHLPILRALLEWFNFEDTGEKGKDVIEMLRRIATEDPPSVQRLLELGADRFLRDLRRRGEHPRRPSTRSSRFGKGGRRQPAPPPAPPSPVRQSPASYAAAAQKAAAGARRTRRAGRREGGRGKMAGEKRRLRGAASARGGCGFGRGRGDSSAPPPLMRRPRSCSCVTPGSRRHRRLARQHEHLGPDASADERAAAMRAHVAEEAALADGAAASRAGEGVLKLRRVLLSPSDEQKVFELGVRLSYADQPALLLAALTELREAVLADLPPQALLQRPRAVDATIALARAVDGPTAMSRVAETRTSGRDDDAVTPAAVRTAALVTLRAFCEALKGALGHAADGAHSRAAADARRRAGARVVLAARVARGALVLPARGRPRGVRATRARANAVPRGASARSAPMPTQPAAHRIALAAAPARAPPPGGDAPGVLESVSPLPELRGWRVTRRRGGRAVRVVHADALDALASRRASDAGERRRLPARRGERAERASRNAAGRDGRRAPQGGGPVFFPALALAAVSSPPPARGCARGGGGRGAPRGSSSACRRRRRRARGAVPGLRAALAAPRRRATTPRGASAPPPRRRIWGCRLRRRPPRTTRRRRPIARRTRRRASRSPHSPAPSTSSRTRLASARLIATCSLRRRAPPRRRTSRRSRATPSASPRRTGSSEVQDVRDATRALPQRRRPSPRGARDAALRRRRRFPRAGGRRDENGEALPGPDAAARAARGGARGDARRRRGGRLRPGPERPPPRACTRAPEPYRAGAGASGEEADAAAAALLPRLPWLE